MSQPIKRPNRFLGLLRLLVVGAAGVGGWFAYDTFVAPDDADAVGADAAPDLPVVGAALAPWPIDLVVADTTWPDGYVVTMQPADDVIRQQIEFDAESGRSRMTRFAQDGSISAVVEANEKEVWIDENAGFRQPSNGGADITDSLRRDAFAAPAVTLADVLDETVWEFTRFRGESPGPSAAMPTRVLSFVIDGEAFASTEPAQAAQWRATSFLGASGITSIELDVEVDAQGHVVGLTNHSQQEPVLYRWKPLSRTPLFTSPISD